MNFANGICSSVCIRIELYKVSLFSAFQVLIFSTALKCDTQVRFSIVKVAI